jgi:hypothetical protein
MIFVLSLLGHGQMDASLGDYDRLMPPSTGSGDYSINESSSSNKRDKKKKRKNKSHRQKIGDSVTSEGSSSFFGAFWNERSSESRSNRRKSRRGSTGRYYREQSCCQDLLCSRMTIILIIAAILGAFIAWRTGAFWTTAQQQQEGMVVPVEEDMAVTTENLGEGGKDAASAEVEKGEGSFAADSVAGLADAEKEALILDLINTDLDLRGIITEGQVSTQEELDTAGSPQHLAYHWVTSLDDPSLLLVRPTRDTHQLNQVLLEAYALAVLYYGGNGYLTYTDDQDASKRHEWKTSTNWLRPTPVCHWYGIDCEDELDAGEDQRHQIVHLNMTHNNVKGALPKELMVLSDLRTIDFNNCGLTGTLPEALLEHMGQLEYLHLQQNSLTGILPTTVGKMTSLRSIQLYKNKFEGSLPEEMNSWTNLHVMALQQNKFNGKIPYLAGLKQLEFLLLHENMLSMHVPFEIFRLLHLVEFNIGKNYLTGTVPSEVESGGKLRKSSLFD